MAAEDRQGSLTELLETIFSQASGDVPHAGHAASSASTSAISDPVEPLRLLIRRAQSQIQSMSLISSNDTIDDLPTSSIRALLLNSVYAQVRSRGQTRPGDFSARIDILRQSKDAYLAFLAQLLSVGVLDVSSSTPYIKVLSAQAQKTTTTETSPVPEDATNRRAVKIASMKLERALTNALDIYRQAVRSKASSSGALRSAIADTTSSGRTAVGSGTQAPDTPYDLLVLPRRQEGQDDEDGEEDGEETFVRSVQTDENGVTEPRSLREYLKMLCHLHAVMALSALDSTFTELQLLQSMPPEAERRSQRQAAEEDHERQRRAMDGGDADDWRLDRRWGVGNDTPILDSKGKPMRPFTILPSNGGGGGGGRGQPSGLRGMGTAQDQIDARRRLQAQVFQPSHRLPTMTIDEYLAEEERRGNIIKDGGQASADRLTTKETLALRAEGHGAGTVEAEEAEEQRRRKAIDWDDFAEANPKGMGNTMNRG